MSKIGDKVVAYIFHMTATGILLKIEHSAKHGCEYLVRVGNHTYWVDRITPA